MREKLKRNWNKTPLIPHKQIINGVFATWGAIALGCLVIGTSVIVPLVVVPLSLTIMYFGVRLSP